MDIERLTHSLKTGLGCLIGFALIKALHSYLYFDQWLIVTILVVMCAQISVGSIVFKSIVRLIGTCAGTALAAFALISFNNDPLAYAGIIALAGIIFSYIATGQKSYSDAGTLGAVTTAIILINPNPSLALAAERFFEISIGIVVATLISQFILPIHARNHLRRNQAQTLKLLSEYYSKATDTKREYNGELLDLDESIVKLMITQRKLAKDAQGELLGSKFEPERFKRLMECEKSILRQIDFLRRLDGEIAIHHLLMGNPEWKKYNANIITAFNQIANKIEDPEASIKTIEITSISTLKAEIFKQENPNTEEYRHTDALFLCLEYINNQLNELATVITR